SATALGEDYNGLVMSRIREEAHHAPSLSEALTRAIGITGTTVTAAGVILAGAFVVLGLAGGSSQTQELGFSIAFSVVLDTFFVRTLLVPSIAMLLGRWNWWPAQLSRPAPLSASRLRPPRSASAPAPSAGPRRRRPPPGRRRLRIALVVTGPASPGPFVALHVISFLVWMPAIAIHVIGHFLEVPRLIAR